MPNKKQGPKIETRLHEDTHRRFQKLVAERDTTMAQLARDAILSYLDQVDVQEFNARESLVEMRIQNMEQRLTLLMTQTGIDVGVVLHLMAARMNAETRDEELKAANRKATARLNRKLESSSLPDQP